MSQSEKWFNQRLALLRTHVREWKDNARQEAQARKELVSKHQAEKDQVRQRANVVEWASYITLYVERLTILAIENEQRHQVLQSRQEQETADLEKRINQERSRNKGALI